MPRNCKVVHCNVDELEERMAEIEGAWAPIAWDFYSREDKRRATVVLARITQTMTMATPPPNLRVRI